MPAFLVVAAAVVLASAGCATPCAADEDCPEQWGCIEGLCAQACVADEDCPLGELCDGRGRCIEDAAGEISWVSPPASSEVAERFDGAVRVRFRGDEALVRVMRDARDPGDDCAPIPPLELRVVGDPEESFSQEVALPGLYSGGRAFSLVASLDVAGGRTSAPLSLVGHERVSSPVSFLSPSEGEIQGDPLLLELRTEVDATPRSAIVRTEPDASTTATALTLDPSTLGLSPLLVPVARGRQAVVIDGETSDGNAFSCGRGLLVEEAGQGLELALWFLASAGDDALVRLRARVDDGTGATVCSSLDPASACEVRREAAALAPSGDEVLVVSAGRNAHVEIVAVSGAVSRRVVVGVRVSHEGRHVAFLGPFAINPERGEAWLAGEVTLMDGVPLVTPRFDVSVGAPF